MISSRATLRSLCVLLLLGTAACEDAPTEPRAYRHETAEGVWVAVTLPAGTPTAQSWSPYVSDEAALAGLRRLYEAASAARAGGDLTRALALEEDATARAAAALTTPPPARVVDRGFDAVERWLAGVRSRAPGHDGLDRDVEAVRASHRAAEGARQAGDTLAAVRHLAAAAARIRDHAPEAVANRALLRAETLLRADADPSAETERAVHLVRSARHALAVGEPVRAMRRALYAVQLAESLTAAPAAAPSAAAPEAASSLEVGVPHR